MRVFWFGFVASGANHELVGQQRPLQAGRHLDKKGIARRVPEAVVDILESVQIEQDERDRSPRFAKAQPFVEGGPVRQTLQRVLKRPLVCLMLQLDMANHRLIDDTHVCPLTELKEASIVVYDVHGSLTLTPLGQKLRPALSALARWSTDWEREIGADRIHS